MFSRATTIEFAAAIAVCFNLVGAVAQQTPDYAAILAAPDRSAADRATDARRDPLKLLTFIDARPGMKVLDMGAGGGYSTELMARAVGPNGVVYGQNAPQFARPQAALEARTKTPAGKPMVGLSRPFDDPLPADVHDLDLVTLPVLLPRHDLHGRRSRQDERQGFLGAQARRSSGDRRPFRRPRRGRHGGTF